MTHTQTCAHTQVYTDAHVAPLVLCRCVSGTDLLVCGKNIYNHYKDCKDANYYLCSDQINDIVYLSREK